jgi:hypothetical protein
MNVLIKCNDKNLKKKLEILSEIYMKVFHLIKKNGKQF